MLGEQPREEPLALACLPTVACLSLIALHALACGFVLMLEVHLVVPLLFFPQLLLVLTALLGFLLFKLFFRNTGAAPSAAFGILSPCRITRTTEQGQNQEGSEQELHEAQVAGSYAIQTPLLNTMVYDRSLFLGPFGSNAKPLVLLSQRMSRLLYPIALFAACALVASCEKDNPSGVPPTGVNISVNINLPEYANLQVPGGWAYITGGSQGIIVYRINTDQFSALDRHCPYQPENLCRVTVDQSNVQARDTACCGSAYLLFNGSVSQGPSSFNLTQYQTNWNGTTLRIFN